MWLPSFYLALSTTMSNPWAPRQRLTSSLLWKSERSSENSLQKCYLLHWAPIRLEGPRQGTWSLNLKRCPFPTSWALTHCKPSQPGWSSFRGTSQKGNTKIKAVLTKGKDYFCMYTPVLTNWLWNTGTFTTYSAQVIATSRTQDVTDFVNKDNRVSGGHQPLTGLNNFL